MAVAQAGGAQLAVPEALAPAGFAAACAVVGDELGQGAGGQAGLGEHLDGGGDVRDVAVGEAPAGSAGGEGGVGNQGQRVGAVAGGAGQRVQAFAGQAHAAGGASGPMAPKSIVTSSPRPLGSGPPLAAPAWVAVGSAGSSAGVRGGW